MTASTLTLSDSGSVTQSQAIVVTGLELLGTGGGYTLTNASNNVSTLAGSTGTVNLVDGQALTVNSVGGSNGLTTSGAGGIALTDSAAGGITTTATTGALATGGAGPITLTANAVSLGGAVTAAGQTVTIVPDNAATTMSLAGSGTLNLTQAMLNNISAATLVFGSVTNSGTSGAVATGDLTVAGSVTVPSTVGNLDLETGCQAICGSSGIITIASGASLVSSNGGTLILADGNAFINDAGSGALVAAGAGARWIVYSQTPANDTKGGLSYGFKQYGTALLGPLNGAIASGESGFVYTEAATATVSLTGVTKTYDGTNAATLAPGNYSVTGNADPNNPDTVTLNDPSSGTYASANAGSGIGVSVSGVTIVSVQDNTGATVYGYGLSSTSAAGSVGTINPLAVVLTGAKTYDATANAAAAGPHHRQRPRRRQPDALGHGHLGERQRRLRELRISGIAGTGRQRSGQLHARQYHQQRQCGHHRPARRDPVGRQDLRRHGECGGSDPHHHQRPRRRQPDAQRHGYPRKRQRGLGELRGGGLAGAWAAARPGTTRSPASPATAAR